MKQSATITRASGRKPKKSAPVKAPTVHPFSFPLILLAAGLIAILLRDAKDPGLIVLAGVNALLALIGVIRATINGLRPVSAAFFIFWFGWLGVGPIAQLTLEKVAWGDFTIFYDRGRLQQALLMNVAAILTVLISEARSRGRAEKRTQSISSSPSRSPVRGWVLAGVAGIHLVIGANAIRTLGLGTYFTSRSERVSVLETRGLDLAATGGAQYALISALPVALSIAGALLSLYRIKGYWHNAGTFFARLGRVKTIDTLAFIYFLVAVCVFANPLSQNRFIALTAFGSLFIALLIPRSKKAAGIFAVIGFFTTLLVYPVLNVFRGGGRQLDVTVEAETFTTLDFDGFQMVVNTITYVQEQGLGWGTHILSAIGYFVPRSFWESKEVPASIDVATFADYYFTNLSLPVHAEFYLEFGWAGMIVGMALVGYFIGRLDVAWQTSSPSKLYYFVPYLAMVTLGFLRGPLGSQVPIYLTVTAILYLAIRSLRPTADAPQTEEEKFQSGHSNARISEKNSLGASEKAVGGNSRLNL